MGDQTIWTAESLRETLEELKTECPRGFNLDDVLDKMSDFILNPRGEKLMLGRELRSMGYAPKLIRYEGERSLRWFKAPSHESDILSQKLLTMANKSGLVGSYKDAARDRERKPLRLPAVTWQSISHVRDEFQRLYPDRQVTLSSTIETLLNYALATTTINGE